MASISFAILSPVTNVLRTLCSSSQSVLHSCYTTVSAIFLLLQALLDHFEHLDKLRTLKKLLVTFFHYKSNHSLSPSVCSLLMRSIYLQTWGCLVPIGEFGGKCCWMPNRNAGRYHPDRSVCILNWALQKTPAVLQGSVIPTKLPMCLLILFF